MAPDSLPNGGVDRPGERHRRNPGPGIARSRQRRLEQHAVGVLHGRTDGPLEKGEVTKAMREAAALIRGSGWVRPSYCFR